MATESPAPRSPLLLTPKTFQLVLVAGAIAAFAWAAYYAFGILRSSAFNNDRAFRVLTEVVAQLDNFQGTMTSLIALIPEQADCAPSEACDAVWRAYTNKLKVPDIAVSYVDAALTTTKGNRRIVAACEEHTSAGRESLAAALANRYEFWLRVDDPGRRFTIVSCTQGSATHGVFALSGKLTTSVPHFISQRFFDQALVALKDGSVIVTVEDADGELDTAQISLQPTSSGGLSVAHSAELLRAAARADAANDAPLTIDGKAPPPPPTDGIVRHPTVFEKTIGGAKYQVFVLPFRPSSPWFVQNDGAGQDKKTAEGLRQEDMLYAIGLKREQLTQQVTYALWPDGTFAITAFSLLTLLAWPLLRVRYSNALEPISRVTAVTTVVSLILIPGILVICGVWVWSRISLINWADGAAEAYAKDIAAKLVWELQTDVALLESYRDGLYAREVGKPCAEEPGTSMLPVGVQDLTKRPVRPHSQGPASDRHRPCQSTTYLRGPVGTHPLGAWSPLRSGIALDESGASYGPRLTAFGNVPQRHQFKVPDREYFQALLAGESWRPEPRRRRRDGDESPWTQVPDPGFVAQRLFNRSDGARALQLAVPHYLPSGEFAGVVAGDSRVYALTASVSPLLLRFAVVDSGSGAVLFHTDDSRSLVENFVVETEQDPRLKAQLARRSSTIQSAQPWLEKHFSGRYLSEPHRFYARPVTGIPWTIVVYYSSKELGDIALQASVASLVTFIGFGILVALVTVFVAYCMGSKPLEFISCLWPRWRWRSTYMSLAWFGSAVVILLLWIGCLAMGHGLLSLFAAFAGAVVFLGALVAYHRHQRVRSHETDQPKSNETHYIFSLYAGVLLVSALPALFVAMRFHDLSVEAFLSNGLVFAGQQIERRHAIIAEDLRRWDPDDIARKTRYPDAWQLTDTLPVPGATTSRQLRQDGRSYISTWKFTTLGDIPWTNLDGPPGADSLFALIWSVTADSPVPRRSAWRSDVNRSGNDTEAAPVHAEAPQRGVAVAQPAQPLVQSRAEERYWQPEYDGHRTKVTIPYEAGSTAHSIPGVVRYGFGILLAAVVLFAIHFLVSRIARKLFGSIGVFRYSKLVSKASHWRAPDVNKEGDFAAMWSKLNQEDRLLLHQLSKDQLINPINIDNIERLAENGLIRFDPWPQIADESLKNFVKTAEDPAAFANWQSEASRSLWNSIRTPLLIVLLIVIGLLLWLSSTSMQIVMTVLAGVATLLGYLGKAQTFIRGSGGTQGP